MKKKSFTITYSFLAFRKKVTKKIKSDQHIIESQPFSRHSNSKTILQHIYFLHLEKKKLHKKSKLTKLFLNLTPFSRDSNSQTLGTPYIVRHHT